MIANAPANRSVKSLDRQAPGLIVDLMVLIGGLGCSHTLQAAVLLLEYSTSTARIIPSFGVSLFDGLCELAPVLRYKIH